jgi:fido (protein-threonine AMPylation protein)
MPSQIIHLPHDVLDQIIVSLSDEANGVPSQSPWRLQISRDSDGIGSVGLLVKPLLLCPNRRPPFQEYLFALLLTSSSGDLPIPRELPGGLIMHLLGEVKRFLIGLEDLSGHELLAIQEAFDVAAAATKTFVRPMSGRPARTAVERALKARGTSYQRVLTSALPQLVRKLERYRKRLHGSGIEGAIAKLDWQTEIGAALELRPTLGQTLVATLSAKSRRGGLRRFVRATQNQLFACMQATLLADPWSFACRLPIGEAELQSLHGALLRDLLPAEDVGCWRSRAIAIHSPLSGKMIARPVPASEVAEQMSDLIETFDRDLWADLNPLMRAGMFHVRFETIHPFADGNGRVGRMVLMGMLAECGWSLLPLNTVLHWRRRTYLDALTRAAATGDDLPFLTFLLKAVETAVRLGHRMLDMLRAERWRAQHALVGLGHDPATAIEVCDKQLSTLVAPNYGVGLAPDRIRWAMEDLAEAGILLEITIDGRTGYLLPAISRLMRQPLPVGTRHTGTW